MSDIAIRVEGLSKAYRIGLKEQQHETMLGAMAAWLKSPFRNFREVRSLSSFGDLRTQGPKDPGSQSPRVPESQSPSAPSSQRPRVPESQSPSDIIWALKDVSFEVKHGEAVGIIGRNGAGKSTLLKILSRITEPTRGRATIYGRVASLLEVGTGFHSDLTGRENVYLNGTILGMKKREVDARFDEIVDFSGVEKFIDTPVKRYSSGMRVRLAFAVAAHLEPEILIVDEVLAVGDAEFQNRCLGKMNEVAHCGRTVLFVSHNMTAVEALCDECILLDSGAVAREGTTQEVAHFYLNSQPEIVTEKNWGESEGPPSSEVRLLRVGVRPAHGTAGQAITVRTPVAFDFDLKCLLSDARLDISFQLINQHGEIVMNPASFAARGLPAQALTCGCYRFTGYLPGDLLNTGSYAMDLVVAKDIGTVLLKQSHALSFEVADCPESRNGYHGRWPGAVRPLLRWEVRGLLGTASKEKDVC